ncbi:MAG: hypothetical protein AAF806_19975 [Bacteroidota bacterium]
MKKNQIFANVRKAILFFVGASILFSILDCTGQKPEDAEGNKEIQANLLSKDRTESVVLDFGVSKVEVNENDDSKQSITFSWDFKKKMEGLQIDGYLFSIEILDNQGKEVLKIEEEPVEKATYTITDLNAPKKQLPYSINTKVALVTDPNQSYSLSGNSQTLQYSDGIFDLLAFRTADGSTLVDSICAMDTSVCAYITLFDSSLQNADTTLELSNYILYSIFNLAEVQLCICDEDIISNADSLFDCISNLTPIVQSNIIQTTVSQDSSILCNLL